MRHASRRASQSLGQAADRVRRVALLLSNAVVFRDQVLTGRADTKEEIRAIVCQLVCQRADLGANRNRKLRDF